MKNIIQIAALSLLSITLPAANADENAVKQALAKSMPDVKIESVKPSEVKGLYEVTVDSNIVYVSENGKYLFQGRLIDVEKRIDLTEQKLASKRLDALNKVGKDKMIVFKPKINKYQVYVFTDIDCGYCRKLHSEIDQYMAQGITINYLFYPRAGKGSESYNKAVSVWCSNDRNAALTAAKKDQKVPAKTCANPVDEHMALAAAFQVSGTPMIITEKGNVQPGYVTATELAEILAAENKEK